MLATEVLNGADLIYLYSTYVLFSWIRKRISNGVELFKMSSICYAIHAWALSIRQISLFPCQSSGSNLQFSITLSKVQKPSSCFIGQETHKEYREKCNSSFSLRFDQCWMFYCHPQDFGGGGGGAQVLCCGYQLNIVSVWKTLRLLKVVLWNHQGPLRKEN